jgi:ArsR family transcriptional regulator
MNEMHGLTDVSDLDPPDEPAERPGDGSRTRPAPVQLVDEETAAAVARAFKVLSDPSRVRLISALSTGELCVADLARAVGISQSATSHQLRLLRHLDLVDYRRVGRLV